MNIFKSDKKRSEGRKGLVLVLFFMMFLICSSILASYSYFTTMRSITGTGRIAVLELEFNNSDGELTDAVYETTYMANLTPGSTIDLTDVKVLSPLWSCYALMRFDVNITKQGETDPSLNYTTVYNLDGEFVNSADAATNTTDATLLEAGVEKNINLSYVLSGEDITNDYMNATVQTSLTVMAIQSSNLKTEVGQEPIFAATTLLNEYEPPYTAKTLTLMVDGVAKSYTLTAGSTMENALKAGGVYETYNLYNTCGFYTDENLIGRLEDEECFWGDKTLYTKTATLDKLSFYDNAGVSEVYALNTSISGEVVVPAYSPSGNPVTTTRYDSTNSIAGFMNCTSITNLALPVTITSLKHRAFYGCNGLTVVYLPNQITTMGQQVFAKSVNLTHISLPEELLEVPRQIALYCDKLQTVKFGNKLTKIGFASFAYCGDLTEISLPSSVKVIDPGAFTDCVALTNVELNEGLEKIDYQAFNNCNKMTTINFPSTLKQIGMGAFLYCMRIENLNLNEGLEWIADFAFDHCDYMGNTNIRIPSTIKQIGKIVYDPNNPDTSVIGTHVFYNCATKNLTSFSIDSSNQYYTVVDGVLYRKNNGVPTVLVAYPSAKSQEVYEMPNTVVDAYECSISRAFNLREVVISDSFVMTTRTDVSGVEEYSNELWANNFTMMMYVYTGVVKYTAKSTNPNYSTDGRSLYSKDGTILYASPVYSLTENDILDFNANTTTMYYGAIPLFTGESDLMRRTYNTTVYFYNGVNISANATDIDATNLRGLNTTYNNNSSFMITIDENNTAYQVVDGKVQYKT